MRFLITFFITLLYIVLFLIFKLLHNWDRWNIICYFLSDNIWYAYNLWLKLIQTINVETSGFNKQTWQKFWSEASKQVFTNKLVTEVTFVCFSRDNFHQTKTDISAKREHRYNTTKCPGPIFNIYWTKDVEDWAARHEDRWQTYDRGGHWG